MQVTGTMMMTVDNVQAYIADPLARQAVAATIAGIAGVPVEQVQVALLPWQTRRLSTGTPSVRADYSLRVPASTADDVHSALTAGTYVEFGKDLQRQLSEYGAALYNVQVYGMTAATHTAFVVPAATATPTQAEEPEDRVNVALIYVVAGLLLIVCLLCTLVFWRRRRKRSSSDLLETPAGGEPPRRLEVDVTPQPAHVKGDINAAATADTKVPCPQVDNVGQACCEAAVTHLIKTPEVADELMRGRQARGWREFTELPRQPPPVCSTCTAGALGRQADELIERCRAEVEADDEAFAAEALAHVFGRNARNWPSIGLSTSVKEVESSQQRKRAFKGVAASSKARNLRYAAKDQYTAPAVPCMPASNFSTGLWPTFACCAVDSIGT